MLEGGKKTPGDAGGLREDGRVSVAFSQPRHFAPLSDFGWQQFKRAPPWCTSFLSPLLSAAVATAKLEIERVVTALIALCQNWASANCLSWEL